MNLPAKPTLFGLALTLGAAAVLTFFAVPLQSSPSSSPVHYGATFSRTYAEHDLGLQPDAVLAAALDDLQIRRFRIPAYWNLLEQQPGVWSFDQLDKDVAAIRERKGSVVLAIGQKLPRWPECWIPDWAKNLPQEKRRSAVLNYLETVIKRYRDNPVISGWQIENEPRFAYGVCPPPDPELLQAEMKLAKDLDPSRPISTTESGELSLWTTYRHTVDSLGVSVYRIVQHPTFGVWRYWFLPPTFYLRKAIFLSMFGLPPIYVSEFQMEPWSTKPLAKTSLDDQLKTFTLEQMQKNFTYAQKMGISPIDFWGVEWWYWMKEKQNHSEFWEEAKTFYRQNTFTK